MKVSKTKYKDEELEKILNPLSKGATHIVASPKTIDELISKGINIEEKFITYEEYFENLITQKRKNAVGLFRQLPLLDNSIANSVISAIYEEIKASFGLGIFTSTIFNSIVLLEYAMRIRLYNKRLENDPNSKWEDTEKLKMKQLISQLKRQKIIDKTGQEQLDSFNDKFRNPYLHINIHKMIQGIYANNVMKVDINTRKVTEENEVDVSKYPHMWFLAKNFYDRSYVMHVLQFCIGWTNDLLKKNSEGR